MSDMLQDLRTTKYLRPRTKPEFRRVADRADIARYWRTLDRALVLSMRDPDRAIRYADDARRMASEMHRPDLAFNANDVLSILGGF